IYKQSGGVGAFNLVYSGINLAIEINYATLDFFILNTSNVLKQTGGTGGFVAQSGTTLSYNVGGIGIDGFGNLYVVNYATSKLQKQTNYAIGLPDLDGGTLLNVAGTGKGTGKSRWQVWTGQKTTSGTDMQTLTKRLEINEEGVIEAFGTVKFKTY